MIFKILFFLLFASLLDQSRSSNRMTDCISRVGTSANDYIIKLKTFILPRYCPSHLNSPQHRAIKFYLDSLRLDILIGTEEAVKILSNCEDECDSKKIKDEANKHLDAQMESINMTSSVINKNLKDLQVRELCQFMFSCILDVAYGGIDCARTRCVGNPTQAPSCDVSEFRRATSGPVHDYWSPAFEKCSSMSEDLSDL